MWLLSLHETEKFPWLRLSVVKPESTPSLGLSTRSPDLEAELIRFERLANKNERSRSNVLVSPTEIRNLIRLVREELANGNTEQPKA